MIYGSVCSGIESASVAWGPLGWEAAFVSEIDPFPCAVLSHHYPDVPNHGDFTQIQASEGPIDLLVGGTPCQSFSVAGLRKGMADDRGNLALEFLRLAGRLQPRWVLWENVLGVLSSNGGRDFGSVLGGLVELGYGFAYRVLDAQYVRVDGLGRAVPQRRRRVFVVGRLGDWRRATAVLFERESLSGNPPPRREAGAVVTQSLTGGAQSSSAGNPDDNRAQGNFLIPVSACQAGRYRKGTDSDAIDTLIVAHSLRADGFDASEDGTGRGTPLVPVAFSFDERQITSNVNRTRVGPKLPCGTLHEQPHVVAFQERGRTDGRTLEWQEDVSYALRASDGRRCGNDLKVDYRWAVRRLTPLECERLQGFPDGWTAVPYQGKLAADGNRYKAIGNSMAVNCMRWIGTRIQMVEEL